MSTFKLLLLGSPRLERKNIPVELERRKALALLAYLAVTAQPHSRETLATLLWPDHDESQAHAYLRRALFTLKHALGAERIATLGHGVSEPFEMGGAVRPEPAGFFEALGRDGAVER